MDLSNAEIIQRCSEQLEGLIQSRRDLLSRRQLPQLFTLASSASKMRGMFPSIQPQKVDYRVPEVVFARSNCHHLVMEIRLNNINASINAAEELETMAEESNTLQRTKTDVQLNFW